MVQKHGEEPGIANQDESEQHPRCEGSSVVEETPLKPMCTNHARHVTIALMFFAHTFYKT